MSSAFSKKSYAKPNATALVGGTSAHFPITLFFFFVGNGYSSPQNF